MVLEFYYDLLSQPCRAVYLLLKAANVDFEGRVINLITGDHHTPEFLKLNPLHKIPIINDDGYVLTESVAILRYVAQKFNVAEHWYPRQDVQKQGRVDEFLNWHHTGLRKHCVGYFLTLFRTRIGVGRFTKIPFDAEKIKELREGVVAAVKEMDEYFLKGRQFLAGDEISVADLAGYCELVHLEAVGEEGTYTANENVNAWMKRVAAKLGHLNDEALVVLKGLQSKYESAKE